MPEPLLPNTPLERLTNSSRFRQTRVSSISRGLPIQIWRSSSPPNTAATSPGEARWAGAKCGGSDLAGCGASPSALVVSIGDTDAVEYAVAPESASASAAPPDATASPARGSLLSSRRSVTMPKKRLSRPCIVTNVPTFTFSTAGAASRRTSSPRESEPPTTAPMRSRASLSGSTPLSLPAAVIRRARRAGGGA